MFVLDQIQESAIHDIRVAFKRAKRVLLQSATGSGKTVIAVVFIEQWLRDNPGKNVLCLFNLQCLLPQFEESFAFHGMRDGVALFHDQITRAKDGTRMVDHQQDTSRRVMLTMPETFAGALRGEGSKDLVLSDSWVKDVGLVLIDEAHKGTSENFQYIRDHVDAWVLGLTATPMRVQNKEGECLANDWQYDLVTTVSIGTLISMGRLVQPLYYDLDEDAHLFREWQRAVAQHSREDGNHQTIWFCRDTAHAKEWEAKLIEVGESCAVITSVDDAKLGTTSQTPNQREVIYKAFETRQITHLISVQALCEGFDCPVAKYCVIDRGVGNKALYQQIIGRVIRGYEGKVNGHVIDRCGNHARHGDIEDYVWDLEAEAQDALVVKLGDKRQISEDVMTRATKVMVKCETNRCPSVYNAKTNLACPHCQTSHHLEVEVPVIVWMKSKFPHMPSKTYPNLFSLLNRAQKGDIKAQAMLARSMDYIWNDDGTISEEYKDLVTIAAMNPRSDKDLKRTFRYAA